MSESKTSLSYAERLGNTQKRQAQAAAEKAAKQAEISESIDRRNAGAGTFAERLGDTKERNQRIAADEAAAKQAKQAEQARIAEKLGTVMDNTQATLGLSYSERVTQLTGLPNQVSTKDLRSPSERARDAAARHAQLASSYDDGFAVE